MSERLTKNLIKYGGSALFVALLAGSYIGARDFAGSALVDKYLILCDAFTVPGMLLICFGAMLWVSTTGALDGLSYAVRFAVYSLIPAKRLERDEKYGDYIERKSQNRVKGYGFLFFAGLITMAVALIFMALYYSEYQG